MLFAQIKRRLPHIRLTDGVFYEIFRALEFIFQSSEENDIHIALSSHDTDWLCPLKKEFNIEKFNALPAALRDNVNLSDGP